MKHINKYRNRGINCDITSDFRFKTERIKGKYKRFLRKKTLRKEAEVLGIRQIYIER